MVGEPFSNNEGNLSTREDAHGAGLGMDDDMRMLYSGLQWEPVP